MSRKERERMTVMAGVTDRKLTLVPASKLMRVSYRQSKRIWKRYQADGDAGLVHRLRGQPSARRKPPELRALALARYGEERYADFGLTLMAEQLLKETVVVDHETLRRWRLAEGQHTVRRRQQKHRQWRERKPSFGAMVQLDGSHHDWLEGRGPQCVLMVMVDDATNQMRARFFAEETTRASYDVLEGWVRQPGLPASLYVDRDSLYRCEGVASIAEQLAGKVPQTQFGRAMEALGVELDSGQPSASQGACGADERGAARPAGQRNAIGGDQRQGKREPFSGREVSAWVQPAVRPGGRQSPGRASSRAAELERSVELGSRARGARRLEGGVRGEAVSIGPAARGVELGAAEGDRADAAQRADAVGVSGAAPSVAGAARRGGAGGVATESEVAQAGENETGEGAGRESSVAPGWRGSREAVLERDQGRGAADARGLPAGDRASGRPPLRSGLPTDPIPSRGKR